MILIERLLPIILFIVLAFKIYRFIKMHVDHKKNMRRIQEYNDFHKQMLEWSNQIKDNGVRDKFLMHNLELLDLRTGSKSICNFNKEKELEIIREKFGKWIPDLVQKHRQEQIDRLI